MRTSVAIWSLRLRLHEASTNLDASNINQTTLESRVNVSSLSRRQTHPMPSCAQLLE
jgi:hypothetical protein